MLSFSHNSIYVDSSLCRSVQIGIPSSTQILRLTSEYNSTDEMIDGSFRLSYGDELSPCIMFNATASNVREALLSIPSISNVNVLSRPSLNELFPFEYEIMISNGEEVTSSIISVPRTQFGKNSCKAFVGGINHRAAVIPIQERKSCSKGQHSLQVILAEASSSLGGTFDLYRGDQAKHGIPLTSSAADMKEFLTSIGFESSLGVSKIHYEGKINWKAWIISFIPDSNEEIDIFVDDRKVTGRNTNVKAYPLIKFQVKAMSNDLSGDFKIVIGEMSTEPISYQATQRKITKEVLKLEGIHEALILGDSKDYTVTRIKIIVNDTLQLLGRKALMSVGDLRKVMTSGDEFRLGSCHLTAEKFMYSVFRPSSDLNVSKYDFFINEIGEHGHTVFNILEELTSFENSCGIDLAQEHEIEILSSTRLRYLLPGKITIEPSFLITEAELGSPFISVEGNSSCILPETAFSLEGVIYEIKGSCGSFCVELKSGFRGEALPSTTNKVQAYYITNLTAYTSENNLNLRNQELFVGNDVFEVSNVSFNRMTLTGIVSDHHFGSSFYRKDNGIEINLVIKAHSTDLDSLQIVPLSNTKGSLPIVSLQGPRGHKPFYHEIGNLPEVQLMIMKDPTPQNDSSFVLSLDGYKTFPIDWPTGNALKAVSDMEASLSSLPHVFGRVEVDVAGYHDDGTEFAFLITFVGPYIAPSIPDIQSEISSQNHGASIMHQSIQRGHASSKYSSHYTSLKSGETYLVNVKAENKCGMSSTSEIVAVTTPEFGLLPSKPQSVLLGIVYDKSSLSLTYTKPAYDGGKPITKYRIEWDTNRNFVSSSTNYRSDEVSIINEEQKIELLCMTPPCYGSFSLSWAGQQSRPLPVDSSAEEVEKEINYIIGLVEPGLHFVEVSRSSGGLGHTWVVTFVNLNGDVGMLEADAHSLLGGNPRLSISELVKGIGDILPGSYTNEVQTIYIHREKGYLSNITGTFTLEFEGQTTSIIDINDGALEMRKALEALLTIHTVNVKKIDRANGANLWIITFTHLVHERIPGSGDISLIRVPYSSLNEPSITSVRSFENVKGTKAMSYTIGECIPGVMYFARVSAYNAIGYGDPSSISKGTSRGQVGLVDNAHVFAPSDSGTSLVVEWDPIFNSAFLVSGYRVEWFTHRGIPEIQQITTSASGGIHEVQVISTAADSNDLSGFFVITLEGESTEMIAYNAEANVVKEKVSYLSSVGSVSVTRDFSKESIQNEAFYIASGEKKLYSVNFVDFSTLFSVGDFIYIGKERHIVSLISVAYIVLEDAYNGPLIDENLGVMIYKWAFGYEWSITFASHAKDYPLMTVSPGINWTG